MNISELVDKVERLDMLHIEFWDDNMNMMRAIDEDNMDRFVANNGYAEVKYIRPGNNKIIVQIANPN